MRRLAIVSLVAGVAACGARGGGAASAARSGPAAVGANAWAPLTWEERHDAMTFLVLPNMAQLFQRIEGAPYPTMTCRTCHGADAEAVAYSMPHGLPPLDPAHLPDEHDADPRRARLAKLMADEVTPQMAVLLGVPLYDARTKTGFSCFGCHPTQGTP